MSNQNIGLNEWAKEFTNGKNVLLYTVTTKHVYPDGKIEEINEEKWGSSIKKELIKTGIPTMAMPGMELSLYKYIFPDGQVYREEVQENKQAGLNCFFLALKNGQDEWVKESLWSDSEIALVCRIVSA